MADQPQISAANRKYVSPSFTNTDPYYSTIQAAINSISDQSATNAYGVYIYPGTYTYNETITLKSYVSLIGAGIDDVIIKGNGTSVVITGPASDSGNGQCWICNLTIDGNSQSAIDFNDTSSANPKTSFIINVKTMTSVSSSAIGMTIGDNQSVNCIKLNCLSFPILPPPTQPPYSYMFSIGIQITLTGNLRIWQSNIYTDSYCIVHTNTSTAYSEAYSCLFGSTQHTFCVGSGTVNIYNCTLAGGIDASGGVVKHINSFHDGPINASGGATIWISGLKWTEEDSPVDVWLTLSGNGTQIIVSNSKLAVNTEPVVVAVGSGTIFKAMNSEFTNKNINHQTNGDTITGPSTVTVYLYYCTLSKDISGGLTAVGEYIKDVSSE